jgi:hypothetical protein
MLCAKSACSAARASVRVVPTARMVGAPPAPRQTGRRRVRQGLKTSWLASPSSNFTLSWGPIQWRPWGNSGNGIRRQRLSRQLTNRWLSLRSRYKSTATTILKHKGGGINLFLDSTSVGTWLNILILSRAPHGWALRLDGRVFKQRGKANVAMLKSWPSWSCQGRSVVQQPWNPLHRAAPLCAQRP